MSGRQQSRASVDLRRREAVGCGKQRGTRVDMHVCLMDSALFTGLDAIAQSLDTCWEQVARIANGPRGN